MSLQSHWQQLKEAEPGRRFHDFYERRKREREAEHPWRRFLWAGLGIVLALGGVVLLGMPGPGLLVMVMGLALLASESEVLARGLDRLELFLRDLSQVLVAWWHQLKPSQRWLCAASILVLALLAAAGLWNLFMA